MRNDDGYAVRIKILIDGRDERAASLPMHPSEAIIAVTNADGLDEQVIVDRRSLAGDALKIGYPVLQDGGRTLVELPRETAAGSWRVWVHESSVIMLAAA